MGRVHLGQGCRRRVKRSRTSPGMYEMYETVAWIPNRYIFWVSHGGVWVAPYISYTSYTLAGRHVAYPMDEARRTLRGSAPTTAPHGAPRCTTRHQVEAVVRLPLRPCPTHPGLRRRASHRPTWEPSNQVPGGSKSTARWIPGVPHTTEYLKNPINHGIFSKLLLGNMT